MTLDFVTGSRATPQISGPRTGREKEQIRRSASLSEGTERSTGFNGGIKEGGGAAAGEPSDKTGKWKSIYYVTHYCFPSSAVICLRISPLLVNLLLFFIFTRLFSAPFLFRSLSEASAGSRLFQSLPESFSEVGRLDPRAGVRPLPRSARLPRRKRRRPGLVAGKVPRTLRVGYEIEL